MCDQKLFLQQTGSHFFFYNVTKAYWLHINKCKNEFWNQMRKIKEYEKIEGYRSGTYVSITINNLCNL